MTGADPAEPDLHPGETSDAVLRLQTRLRDLGYFAGTLDGYFGDDTAAAVRWLLQDAGLADSATVDAQAWAALAGAEQSGGPPKPVDEHWRWDGESWQPNVAASAAAPPAAPHVDDTGQWVWDGTTWQPVVG